MSEPTGFSCPGCGQPAELVLVGGVQAFCGNDDCAVFSWNPTKTVEELADSMGRISFGDPDTQGEPWTDRRTTEGGPSEGRCRMVSEIWINTEPAVDGSGYVVTLSASDDVAVTLTPDRALRHALGVLRAAHQAAYDAAILRQLTTKLQLELETAAQVVKDLREDRPPLDPGDTEPLSFEPGVNQELMPFLVISVNGERVGQWTVDDAEGHAQAVLATVVVADLDSAYYRTLIGLVGIEEPRARNVVEDIANWRGQR